jgi:hypothetical protein
VSDIKNSVACLKSAAAPSRMEANKETSRNILLEGCGWL